MLEDGIDEVARSLSVARDGGGPARLVEGEEGAHCRGSDLYWRDPRAIAIGIEYDFRTGASVVDQEV
jgi:hypothetical protein